MVSLSPKQSLALAFIDFLSKSLTDGTLSADDRETVEVAQQSVADLFKVDVSAAAGSANLLSAFEKASQPAAPGSAYPTDDQKKAAETLKSQGNAAMAKKDYPAAIDFYTQALAIIPGNPVYLSNRAAAYSASKDHASAKADAEAAVATDPTYTKAWSRLGLANFALGDAAASVEAYQKGIEYEGNGGSEAMKKGLETAQKRVAELGGSTTDKGAPAAPAPGAGANGLPDLSALAGMFGGEGGMPDLGSIMSNPMFANMAQQFMSNPAMMDSLMNNPKIKEMAEQFGMGPNGPANGQKPDLNKLMNDPKIAEMAKNFMGGK